MLTRHHSALKVFFTGPILAARWHHPVTDISAPQKIITHKAAQRNTSALA